MDTTNKMKVNFVPHNTQYLQKTMIQISKKMTITRQCDRIPSTTPGAEPPRDAKDSGSARSHSTHLETSSSSRP